MLAKNPLGFRPFFLLASYSTVISLVLWAAFYTGSIQLTSSYGALYWHSHEMIFGFSMAIIAGFLLTAVGNWTGLAMPAGKQLTPMILVWTAGRILPFTPASLWFISVIDLLFIPLLIIALIGPLIKAKKFKNLVMAILLTLLFSCNLAFHLELLGFAEGVLGQSLYASIDLIILMVIIITGRIMPFFTGKVLVEGGSKKYNIIEIGAVLSAALLLVADLGSFTNEQLKFFFAAAAIIHAVRLAGWYQRGVHKIPVLLILYVGYSWLICGFTMKALAGFELISGHTIIHSFTAGAIGVIILAMMARVSLGHTGRKIQTSPWINLSFILINLAVFIRVFVPLISPEYYIKAVSLSGVLWSVSFLLFSVIYTPTLLQIRADGKDG